MIRQVLTMPELRAHKSPDGTCPVTLETWLIGRAASSYFNHIVNF